MGGRKGKKTKSKQIGREDTTERDKATPKSIIVYRGEVGNKMRGLMHEWRRVFLPWSSKKLHGKNNTMKDYLHVASVFSASHLHLLTTPSAGASLRLLRFPSGPTLSFRIESYTLRDDIVAQQRRPAPVTGPAYDVSPIVVLNNFNLPGRGDEVALQESTFQALFPSLNVSTAKPSEIQRVVLFHHDPTHGTVEMRHYVITTKAVGLSRTVKKLMEGRIPTKLGTTARVEDVLEQEAAWSDTDGEGEEVELAKPFKQHTKQTRVKLVEVGPRMTLRLIKVEAGFAGGEVLWHSHIHKSPAEKAAIAKRVRETAGERKRLQRIQEENIRRKREAEQERKDKKKGRRVEGARERVDDEAAAADTFAADADDSE